MPGRLMLEYDSYVTVIHTETKGASGPFISTAWLRINAYSPSSFRVLFTTDAGSGT